MYAQVEKPKENKSRTVANSVTQNKDNEAHGFELVDNRSNTFAKKLYKNKPIENEMPLQSHNISEYAHPIQRKINWDTVSQRLVLTEEEKNVEGLIGALQRNFQLYGQGFHPKIREVVELANSRGKWSISDVYNTVNAEAKQFGLPVNDAGIGLTGITLPTNAASQRDFGFSSHTRAVARVGGQAYERDSHEKHGHAEEQLKPLLEKLADEEKVDLTKDTLILTINNFPCLNRCVPLMLKLKEKYPFMRINYANPYGEEEFGIAYQKLREVGIELVPFEPRNQMTDETKGALTSDQKERFDKMAVARSKHPTPIQVTYEWEDEGVLDKELPPIMKQRFIDDVFSGKVKAGDRFEVKGPYGNKVIFTYWGFNRDGKLVVKVFESK